jgi:hypothetical protein
MEKRANKKAEFTAFRERFAKYIPMNATWDSICGPERIQQVVRQMKADGFAFKMSDIWRIRDNIKKRDNHRLQVIVKRGDDAPALRRRRAALAREGHSPDDHHQHPDPNSSFSLFAHTATQAGERAESPDLGGRRAHLARHRPRTIVKQEDPGDDDDDDYQPRQQRARAFRSLLQQGSQHQEAHKPPPPAPKFDMMMLLAETALKYSESQGAPWRPAPTPAVPSGQSTTTKTAAAATTTTTTSSSSHSSIEKSSPVDLLPMASSDSSSSSMFFRPMASNLASLSDMRFLTPADLLLSRQAPHTFYTPPVPHQRAAPKNIAMDFQAASLQDFKRPFPAALQRPS